jgi:hypothetical protein
MIHAFRLRAIMKQGTASLPETWTYYSAVEEARADAKVMYHKGRVLRVMMVTDSEGSVSEWIDRSPSSVPTDGDAKPSRKR